MIVMLKCEVCGEELSYPFECNVCGKILCSKHKLPENHECGALPKNQRREEYTLEKPLMEEGELHFSRKYSGTVSEQVQKPHKRAISVRSPGLIVAFLVVTALLAFLSYNAGSKVSWDSGYTAGYSTGYLEGNFTSYDQGYADGVAYGTERSYNIRDPTYHEMIAFIAFDKTDANQYVEDEYVCWNFAADVKNNAFRAGFRCGYVHIIFPSSSHAIVCFNTTDHGIVYVEPQDDQIVELNVGQHFWNSTKYVVPYDDTIVKFGVFW